MEYGRTSHAVYELKYHLVWVPKWRRMILTDPVARRLKRIFAGIAERYGFAIVEQEVQPDHVHLFVNAPPRFSPAELVKILKSVSWNRLMKEMPDMREVVWGGALWSSGYFVRATGDAVTAEVIKRYIRYQRSHAEGPKQLPLNL
ncbi:MAG: IS200/IS605 family transposase [Elusimicrobia bacterium]|nr:IS200/IS605 family transposase [Elusimicrobiota bacterium]